MPGPEQPDKVTDKSSTQSGKIDKSAGEKLSQDAFPPPPKDGMGGSSSKGTPTDKFSQGSDKTPDPVKTPTDSSPPEKQPTKQPSDFGTQSPPEKQPTKP